MSLTSLLDQPDVRAKFKEVFPSPPRYSIGDMRAAPLTKNYSLVGTAFDYLLRFTLERGYPTAHRKLWIAEGVLHMPWLRQQRTMWEQAQIIVGYGRMAYQAYLANGECTDDLLYATLCLAQLDPIFRRRVLIPDLGKIDPLDIEDLRALLALVPNDLYAVQTVCLLNPTFGIGSQLVGGADADLVIDDTIIDIKTIQNPAAKQRDYYNQIIGYYLLSRLGGVQGIGQGQRVQRVGVYLSRYGVLRVFEVDQILEEVDIESFTEWFVQRAEREFATNLSELKGEDRVTRNHANVPST